MDDTWHFYTELVIGPIEQVVQLIQHLKDDQYYWPGKEYWLALSDSRGWGSAPWTDGQRGISRKDAVLLIELIKSTLLISCFQVAEEFKAYLNGSRNPLPLTPLASSKRYQVISLRTLAAFALAESHLVGAVLAAKTLPSELLTTLLIPLLVKEKQTLIRKYFSETEIVSSLSSASALLLMENVNNSHGPFLSFSMQYPELLLISATTCDWDDHVFDLHLTRAGKTFYTRQHLDFRAKKEQLEELRSRDPEELRPFYSLLRPYCLQPRGRFHQQHQLRPPLYKWWRFHSKQRSVQEDSDVQKLLEWPFAPHEIPQDE